LTHANSGARWLWLSLAVIVIDRITKFAIESKSLFFRRPLVPGVVALVHNQNPGIAFGVFSESKSPLVAPLLLLVAGTVVVVLAWILVSGRADRGPGAGPGGWLTNCGLALILGGAAGNAIDRVLRGSVTDFLEVRLGTYIWPPFNVADSAITIGAICIGMAVLRGFDRT
jgi:signal peptidase II